MAAQSKALATSQVTLPNRRDPSSVRAALSEKPLASETISVVSAMLRGYANGGANASGSYIGALGEVLSHYPRMIALRAGDLLTGVPRDTKFLPTPADVIAWCERELQEWRTIVARDDHDKALRAEAQERAERESGLAKARALRPTLPQMQDQYGPNWGINEGDSIGAEAKEKQTALFERANRISFERECLAAGMSPDSAVSPELTKIINATRPVRSEAAE
jgi:hypothetical protein